MLTQKKTNNLNRIPVSQIFLEQHGFSGSFGAADSVNLPLFTGLANPRTSKESRKPPP